MTTHPIYNWLLWASTFAAVVVLCILAPCGCGGSQQKVDVVAIAADADACAKEVTRRILESDGCTEMQLATDAVISTMKECKGWVHFEVCALVLRDGGSHDD